MKLTLKAALLAVLVLLDIRPVFALAVVRGPYLQMQTEHGMTVRWRTDFATTSVVRFGLAPDALTSTVTVAGSRTEHVVTLSSLDPAQQYYYSVGDSIGPLAGDASYHFYTAPTPGVPADTRIWVIGDSGTKDANAAAVYSAFKTWSASDRADFWIMLGDNAYDTGTDAEYQAAIFNMYPEFLRQLPLWATLGNHDAGNASSVTQTGPYYDIFSFPKNAEAGGYPSGTEAYYSFDYANIHFINLNSQDISRAVNGSMMQWLEVDLAINELPWVIAFWHHPPYTKGSHDSDTETQLIEMRENFLPLLEAWGVDLVLTGHSHSYERSYLLDGHYGTSTSFNLATHALDAGSGRESGTGVYEKPGIIAAQNAGAVYAVAGSSGKISGGLLNHPAMFFSLNSLGSLVLDVAGNRMDVTFINQSGTALDNFSLVKTPDSDPPLITGASATDANHVVVDFNESLNSTQALNSANYAIAGLSISQAELLPGNRSVRLTTSDMSNGASYTLVVNNLQDLEGNTILAGSTVTFDFFELMTLVFQDGISPNPAYLGTRDAYIRQASATTTHGLETSLRMDGDDPLGTLSDINSLLYWDTSAIPVDATVIAANFKLTVTNTSSGIYDCYSLLRAWTESQTTWNLAASGSAWASAGAAGAADRGTQKLCTVSASSLGTLTINLTQAGLDLVQSWVNDPAVNRGIIIANTSPTDGADFHSRESTTALARPRLEVVYRVPVTPVNNDPVASFLYSCSDLSCTFSDTSTDSDGSISAWVWDFGDGSTATAQNPAHTFAAAGSFTVSLTVTDNEGATDQASDEVTIIDPPPYIDQFAQADLPSAGTVSGTYVNTQTDNGVTQSITERESSGQTAKRYSYLSHTWQFSVAAGSAVTLHANTWSSASTDGDSFQFAWSSNNTSFLPLFTVTGGNSTSMQSAAIPASGTIYIRVTDTNRTAGNRALDMVFVDHLYIRTDSGPPPPPPAIVLTATGRVVKSKHTIDLSWTGAAGASVDVKRDGSTITTTTASAYTDNTANKGAHTYLYQVCLAGTSTCSNDATVVF